MLRLIPQDKNEWRDPSLLNLATIPFDKLRVHSAGEEVDLERDPTNHLWFMNVPLHARADSALINGLLGQLQQVEVSAFVSDDAQADMEPYGLQTSAQTPDLAFTFLQRTNVVAGLQVGASPSNHLELAYARRLDPANIVVVDREPFRAWQGAYTNFLDQHFISVSPSWIESIDVRGEDAFTVQKQSNGQWQVQAEPPLSPTPCSWRIGWAD